MNAPAGPLRAADGAQLPRSAPRRGRHLWLIAGFVHLVLAPTVIAGWYLWTVAADQYGSRTAFSVRSNEATAPLEIFGAVTQLGNSSAVTDAQILYDFIQSQQIVAEVRATLPLEEMYNHTPGDVVFALGEDRPIEDLVEYWNWMVDISVDPSTGLLTAETRAFTPEDARAIARAILESSARLINTLSEQARNDAVGFAKVELDAAERRLRAIRTRLRTFRDVEQDVDPTQNAGAAMGLVASLEADLARAQVRLESMTGVLDAQAPRVLALRRHVATLKSRIAAERTRIGSGATAGVEGSRPLSAVVGEYEELVVDREFAEQAYTLSLAAYEQAQAEARRRQRYLAAHIQPTLSQDAEYPDRLLCLLAVFSLCAFVWGVFLMLYYNFRDHR